jgi:hypothetical protein
VSLIVVAMAYQHIKAKRRSRAVTEAWRNEIHVRHREAVECELARVDLAAEVQLPVVVVFPDERIKFAWQDTLEVAEVAEDEGEEDATVQSGGDGSDRGDESTAGGGHPSLAPSSSASSIFGRRELC